MQSTKYLYYLFWSWLVARPDSWARLQSEVHPGSGAGSAQSWHVPIITMKFEWQDKHSMHFSLGSYPCGHERSVCRLPIKSQHAWTEIVLLISECILTLDCHNLVVTGLKSPISKAFASQSNQYTSVFCSRSWLTHSDRDIMKHWLRAACWMSFARNGTDNTDDVLKLGIC